MPARANSGARLVNELAENHYRLSLYTADQRKCLLTAHCAYAPHSLGVEVAEKLAQITGTGAYAVRGEGISEYGFVFTDDKLKEAVLSTFGTAAEVTEYGVKITHLAPTARHWALTPRILFIQHDDRTNISVPEVVKSEKNELSGRRPRIGSPNQEATGRNRRPEGQRGRRSAEQHPSRRLGVRSDRRREG